MDTFLGHNIGIVRHGGWLVIVSVNGLFVFVCSQPVQVVRCASKSKERKALWVSVHEMRRSGVSSAIRDTPPQGSVGNRSCNPANEADNKMRSQQPLSTSCVCTWQRKKNYVPMCRMQRPPNPFSRWCVKPKVLRNGHSFSLCHASGEKDIFTKSSFFFFFSQQPDSHFVSIWNMAKWDTF